LHRSPQEIPAPAEPALETLDPRDVGHDTTPEGAVVFLAANQGGLVAGPALTQGGSVSRPRRGTAASRTPPPGPSPASSRYSVRNGSPVLRDSRCSWSTRSRAAPGIRSTPRGGGARPRPAGE